MPYLVLMTLQIWFNGGLRAPNMLSYAGFLVGAGWLLGVRQLLVLTALAASAVGLLVGFAVLAARTTVYTITSRRLVMRIGIALPMTLNLPFKTVVSASARSYPDGTADVPLQLAPQHRLAFLILWPHCRPWQVRKPEPMLRRIPDGARVASLLAQALATYHRTHERPDDVQEPAVIADARAPIHDTVAA